jgi:hypothetical protein
MKGSVSVLIKTKGASSDKDNKEVRYKELQTKVESMFMKSRRALMKKGTVNLDTFKRLSTFNENSRLVSRPSILKKRDTSKLSSVVSVNSSKE